MKKEEWNKEFKEWFDNEKYILQFSLVDPKRKVEDVIRDWMEEAYLAGRKRGQEEIGKLIDDSEEEWRGRDDNNY